MNDYETPVIKAVKVERIKREDGSEDVIVHVPRLEMNAALAAHKQRLKQLKAEQEK